MIKVNSLNKRFREKIILKDFNFQITKNKITAILGTSGVGKTTLLNILSGLDNNYTGNIDIETDKIAYVFQEDRLLEWLSVIENIKYVLDKPDYNKIDKILEILGIKSLKNTPINKLSGGQKQRVNIARAFAFDSNLIFMDEAFKSLDIKTKNEIFKKLIKLLEFEQKTVLMVTHDVREAILLADTVSIMKDYGEISKTIDITIPQSSRSLENDQILQYEKSIYKSILK